MQRAQPKCTLCFDDFMEARRLPCDETHVFCCKCLYHHIRGSNEDGLFRCPLCDSQHAVPENGVSGVREQFPLATGLTTPQEASEETSENKVFCKVKGHQAKELVLYCKDHDKMLCANCLAEEHKAWTYSKFEEEVPRQKTHIQELLVKLQQFSDHLRKLADDTKATYNKSDKDIEHMEKMIEDTFHELNIILNKTKSLSKVQRIKNQRNRGVTIY